MTTTNRSTNQETLRLRWQTRCAQGSFSPSVLGIGTVRIFGKSGDAPLTFPRIESLAALDTLEVDERWAIGVAQDVVTAARANSRPVMATQPARGNTAPAPTPIQEFDPKQENILVLSLTRGG